MEILTSVQIKNFILASTAFYNLNVIGDSLR